jgi:hypothetical protein
MSKRKPHGIDRRDVLKRATFAAAALLLPIAANAQVPAVVMPMSADLTADEIRSLLALEPNATCGFVRVTYVSKDKIAPGGLPAPFADGRPLGSALYFLVTPEAPVRLHRIRNDQFYQYYIGDPREVFMLHAVGPPAHLQRLVIAGQADLGEIGRAAPRSDGGVAVHAFLRCRCRRKAQVQVAALGGKGAQGPDRHRVIYCHCR